MSQAVTARAQRRMWTDTLPDRLWLRLGITVLLTVILGAVALRNYAFLDHVAQTIGHDAVPSIVAAEKIRSKLAEAHTELTNASLNKESAEGPSMQAFRRDLHEARDELLTAAQNITYGDEERAPILAMMDGLGDYERLVGAAGQGATSGHAMADADVLMRDKILPAASQLDAANFAHLDTAYQRFKGTAGMWHGLTLLAIAALAIALLETQHFLYRHFRRLLNLPLAGATLILAVCALMFASHGSREMEALRAAKEDAFDSIHALSRAQAVAYAANADENLYLLRNGDVKGQDEETLRFADVAQQIWHGDMSPAHKLPQDLSALKGQGMLGDELANITFPGEGEAATATLNAWLAYVAIDQHIRELEAAGQHAAAVQLCLGHGEGESDWAFSRFDKALEQTLQINSDAFARSTAEADLHVRWLLYCAIAMIVAPLLGAAFGVQRRLAEFRA